jgi:quercetin 2,3-dioxygenase
MNKIIHTSESRGSADYGWLKTRYTFSFADYFDRQRMHFGALRVLNDDVIAGGAGFGMHPHANMEIITIPLEGVLEHTDSMGNKHLLYTNEVQVMSAGTGIRHSEFNGSSSEESKLLQLWIIPAKQNVEPRYDQLSIDAGLYQNSLYNIVGPKGSNSPLWINQQAWLSMASLSKGTIYKYKLLNPENGVYLFVIYGSVVIDNDTLNSRDGIGIWNTPHFNIESESDCKLLFIEVPMSIV